MIISPCANCNIKCCTKFFVPLTIFDVKRIKQKINKNIVKFGELIDYKTLNQNFFNSIFFLKDNRLEEKILVLKRIKNSCIFFSDEGICKIWAHHPISCKCYPFYDFDKKTKKLKYVKNFICPRKWREEEKKSFDFIGAIEKLREEILEHNKLIREWNALHCKKNEEEFFLWLEQLKI
ncbi:MAG: YkgJ family cysteine cluster protein [Candidatus Omnitrophica bacterium]|nr:YkgJ family cysteine cluster protein [Candidatus Omnitrophota bacterium]